MSDDYPNFGKVSLGYRAFCWFGRPLLLSNRIRSYEKDRLAKIIDVELTRGCDGFVFRLNAKSNDASFAKQMASLEQTLRSYSQAAFIYIEVIATGIERSLLDTVKRYSFPRGHMIASRNPGVLVELWRLDSAKSANFAIIVDTKKAFSNIGRCPYTTVEILDSLATHDRIWEVHHSMKEVFVRATYRKGSSLAANEVKKIEKRVNWLAHEKVDAIITDRTDLLSSILGLGAWTQSYNGLRCPT